MTIKYETNCNKIALNKEAIVEEFFILSKGLAGEVLQKFINYQTKFAIYGDFSKYTSKPIRDFIYESNNGKDIFFVKDDNEAINKLRNQRWKEQKYKQDLWMFFEIYINILTAYDRNVKIVNSIK